MSIAIRAIKFNHDPNSASHDALNIRKNKSLFVNAYLRWRMKQGYWTTQYRMSFGNLHASIK